MNAISSSDYNLFVLCKNMKKETEQRKYKLFPNENGHIDGYIVYKGGNVYYHT